MKSHRSFHFSSWNIFISYSKICAISIQNCWKHFSRIAFCGNSKAFESWIWMHQTIYSLKILVFIELSAYVFLFVFIWHVTIFKCNFEFRNMQLFSDKRRKLVHCLAASLFFLLIKCIKSFSNFSLLLYIMFVTFSHIHTHTH